jgi:hypothetical protein
VESLPVPQTRTQLAHGTILLRRGAAPVRDRWGAAAGGADCASVGECILRGCDRIGSLQQGVEETIHEVRVWR